MKTKHIVGTLILIAIVGGIAAVTYFNRQQRSPDGLVVPVASRLRPVETVVLEPVDLTETFLATGLLGANRDVSLLAEAPGKVQKIFKKLGDFCRRGEILARLDPESYQIARQQAEAAVEQSEVAVTHARRDLERMEKLWEQAVVPEQQMEEADRAMRASSASLKQARAGLRAARRNLRETEVRCPFDGYVAGRSAEVGQMIGPQSPLARLVDTEVLLLSVSVPAAQLRQIAKDQRVRISDPSVPGEHQTGIVARIGVAADESTRSFPVEVEIPGQGSIFRTGQVVQAEFVLKEHKSVLAVPRRAIHREGGSSFVSLVQDGRVRRVSIQEVVEIERQVIVHSGVEAGDRLIVAGGENLDDGDEVDVVTTANHRGR